MNTTKIIGVNPDNLLKISSYAKKINKSITWVHKLIENKEVKSLKIDGVIFISQKPLTSTNIEVRLKACNEIMQIAINRVVSGIDVDILRDEINANNKVIDFLNKEEV